MNIFFRYLLFVSIFVSLQSCITFQELNFKGISSHRIEEISFKNGIKINLSVKLENPNWFGIKVRGGEVNIKANGINLGKFQISKPVEIPKKSDGVIDIAIDAKVKNILGGGLLSLIKMASSGGKFKIEIEGYVKASALGMKKKVKISTTEYIGL